MNSSLVISIISLVLATITFAFTLWVYFLGPSISVLPPQSAYLAAYGEHSSEKHLRISLPVIALNQTPASPFADNSTVLIGAHLTIRNDSGVCYAFEWVGFADKLKVEKDDFEEFAHVLPVHVRALDSFVKQVMFAPTIHLNEFNQSCKGDRLSWSTVHRFMMESTEYVITMHLKFSSHESLSTQCRFRLSKADLFALYLDEFHLADCS